MIDFEQKHAKDLQRIRKFRLLDDDFMGKVFEDIGCTEFLLQTILQKKDLKVKSVHVQHDIKNLQGRSVRLDILAVDSEEKIYNVEIQRNDKGASAKRARYNSSMIDANVTEPRDDYEKLAETYVIFITENDVLKGNQSIYHIDRTIRELDNALFADGSHIIYVNAETKEDSEIGKLMCDFSCTDADEIQNEILANRVRFFKEDPKGVEIMCRSMEEMRNETKTETLITLVSRYMTAHGCGFDDSCSSLGLTSAEKDAVAAYVFGKKPGLDTIPCV